MEEVRLGEYISFSHLEMLSYYKNPGFKIDDQGIMRVDYEGEIGIQYHPVAIEQYALMNYNAWIKTEKKEYLDVFFQQVEWLTHHFDYVTEQAIAIPYHATFHDLVDPWYSALDAAHFLSILSRAYVLTSDKQYLALMRKSRNFLMLPIEDGGVKSSTEDGYVWIEEYPSKECEHVLNGFQFVIIGLADYLSCVDDDLEVKALYEVCLQSLRKCVGRYEKFFWLVYEVHDKKYHFVSTHYMPMQAQQMYHLYNICYVDKNVNGGGRWLYYYWKWKLFYIISPVRYIRMLPMSWQNSIFKIIATK